MAGPVNYRLSAFAIVAMIFFAAFADLLTLIPLAGDVIGPVYWVLISFFLYLKGFGIINGRRLSTSIISTVAEMIPAVQALPMIMAGTVVLIVFSRIEDKIGISLTKGKAGINSPLNQNGVRTPLPRTSGQEASSSKPDDSPRQPLNMNGSRGPSREMGTSFDTNTKQTTKDSDSSQKSSGVSSSTAPSGGTPPNTNSGQTSGAGGANGSTSAGGGNSSGGGSSGGSGGG